MVQRRWAATSLLHAPFGALAKGIIRVMIWIEGGGW